MFLEIMVFQLHRIECVWKTPFSQIQSQMTKIGCIIHFLTPDDHARVPLTLQDKIAGTDYINASFVDVSDSTHNVNNLCSSPSTGLQ